MLDLTKGLNKADFIIFVLYIVTTTRYGLDGPADTIPGEPRFPATVQTRPRAHPDFYKMGTGFLYRELSGRGVALNSHPLIIRCSL